MIYILPINQFPSRRLPHKGCPRSLFDLISANSEIIPESYKNNFRLSVIKYTRFAQLRIN